MSANPPKKGSGSSESVQQHLHLAYANYGSQQGSRFSEWLIHKPPNQQPLLLLLPSLHIRQMRLTFTQLSTLQRREIYSASGRDWSQVSTWTSPHDDPVAQPWNEAGLQSNRGGNGERGRRRWLDSPRLFLWQIPTDVLGEDNKRCASRSTLKRPAKLITLFHLSHSEDSLPWIQPQRKE